MKKRGLLMLAVVPVLLVSACHPQGETTPASSNEPEKNVSAHTSSGQTLASFSYQEDAAVYRAGDPGVKTTGFVNTDPCPIKGQNAAAERARNECTIAYNATSESYDPHTEMWRIDFFTAAVVQDNGDIWTVAGNCQSVYLNSDGVTQLIVYGE